MIGSKYKDIMKHLRKFLKGFNDRMFIIRNNRLFESVKWIKFVV